MGEFLDCVLDKLRKLGITPDFIFAEVPSTLDTKPESPELKLWTLNSERYLLRRWSSLLRPASGRPPSARAAPGAKLRPASGAKLGPAPGAQIRPASGPAGPPRAGGGPLERVQVTPYTLIPLHRSFVACAQILRWEMVRLPQKIILAGFSYKSGINRQELIDLRQILTCDSAQPSTVIDLRPEILGPQSHQVDFDTFPKVNTLTLCAERGDVAARSQGSFHSKGIQGFLAHKNPPPARNLL